MAFSINTNVNYQDLMQRIEQEKTQFAQQAVNFKELCFGRGEPTNVERYGTRGIFRTKQKMWALHKQQRRMGRLQRQEILSVKDAKKFEKSLRKLYAKFPPTERTPVNQADIEDAIDRLSQSVLNAKNAYRRGFGSEPKTNNLRKIEATFQKLMDRELLKRGYEDGSIKRPTLLQSAGAKMAKVGSGIKGVARKIGSVAEFAAYRTASILLAPITFIMEEDPDFYEDIKPV